MLDQPPKRKRKRAHTHTYTRARARTMLCWKATLLMLHSKSTPSIKRVVVFLCRKSCISFSQPTVAVLHDGRRERRLTLFPCTTKPKETSMARQNGKGESACQSNHLVCTTESTAAKNTKNSKCCTFDGAKSSSTILMCVPVFTPLPRGTRMDSLAVLSRQCCTLKP